MAEAKTVTRIVKGPKPIIAYNAKGKKVVYGIGEEVQLAPHAAKTFARYLTTPELAKAEAAVRDAEEKAAKEEARLRAADDADDDTDPVLSVAEKAALANKEKADAEAAEADDDD